MRTNNEILTEVYKVVTTYLSPLSSFISGNVYKNTRLTDSIKEDCVIHLITGLHLKFAQNGALYVKIFYKDLFQNNSYFEDTTRGDILQKYLFNISEILLDNKLISFDRRTREFSIEQAPNNQHYVILKINYQLLY